MKKTAHLILLFSLFLCLKTHLHGQILRGYAFQYFPSGDSVALAGVQVSIVGKPIRTQSKSDGSFQLFLHDISEGEKITLNIEKNGWKILNDTVLKRSFRVGGSILHVPSVFLCTETNYETFKTPFYFTDYIQKTYQKRLTLLNQDWILFSRTFTVSDIKLKNIVAKRESLTRQHRFLLTHATDLADFVHTDNQSITSNLSSKMITLLKEGKIEEASNIINKTQFKILKQKYLDSLCLTQCLSELSLLAFLKAQCAMLQFNTEQADFYFNEAIAQEPLKIVFYDDYTQFLLAFGEFKKAFENIQTLLIKANAQSSRVLGTEGVVFAYSRLQELYFDKKLYDLAQKAGQNALLRLDTLALMDKKNSYNAIRARIMRQLAFVHAQQDTLPVAIRISEKSLLLPSEPKDLPKTMAIRLLLTQSYQKMYERMSLADDHQKVLYYLSVLEKDFAKNDSTTPSVKAAFEQFKNLKSYIEEINKPRFLSKRKEILTLEASLKYCKTTAQTIFYRSQIIDLLQKLNGQLLQKSTFLDIELANHYRAQAIAQIEQQNYKEVEANISKALLIDSNDDNLKAFLASVQWLQNKKSTAEITFKSVKDTNLILKTISYFEKKGIPKGIFAPLCLGFGYKKTEL